jgi:hypothetical protein
MGGVKKYSRLTSSRLYGFWGVIQGAVSAARIKISIMALPMMAEGSWR